VKQTFAPNKPQSDEKAIAAGAAGDTTDSAEYPFVCLLEDGEDFAGRMDDLLRRVMSLLNRSCKEIIQHRVFSRLRCLESGNHEDTKENETSATTTVSTLVPVVPIAPFCHYRQTYTRHYLTVTCMALYGSSYLVTGSGDRRVLLWDRDNMEVLHTFTGPAGVHSLLISGDYLFIAYTNKTITIWNLLSRTLIMTHTTRNIEAMILLPTDDPSVFHLYTGHSKSFRRSDVCLEFDPPTIHETVSLVGRDDTVYCTAIFQNHILFTGSVGHTIRVWDIRYFGTDHTIVYLSGHTGRVRCLLIRGTQLFSGSDDHTIRIWDIITLTPVTIFQGHEGAITALTTLGSLLYSASRDHTIGVWNLLTNERIHRLKEHSEGINCLALDSHRLYSGGGDYTVKIWEEGTLLEGSSLKEPLRIQDHPFEFEEEEKDDDPFEEDLFPEEREVVDPCDMDLLQEEEEEELPYSEEPQQESQSVAVEDID
jgi:hypothetical protein